MNFTTNLIINTYSIVLLIFVYIHALKHNEKVFLQHKLFMMLVQVTMLMLVVDIFSRFDGNPGTIYSVINHLGNFLIYLLNPVLPSLWLLYVHCQIFDEEDKMKQWIYPLIAINAVNVFMLILSQAFGWFYYIDSGNIYHRGILFWVPASIMFGLNIAAFILIIANRENIEKKYYLSLVFFLTIPLACAILQIILYGTSLVLNGITLSLLIAFFNIQNRNMSIDYLTGAYNRKKLEVYMKEKISTSTENKTFSAILIDLDNFKSINDTFGHDMGDDALVNSVKLLKSCLRSVDFIARFGGDEFYIILDISNSDDLDETICRIDSCIEKFNEQSAMPYKLSFSMGYAVYDYHSHMKVEEFQKQIDILMYENKRINKEIKN